LSTRPHDHTPAGASALTAEAERGVATERHAVVMAELSAVGRSEQLLAHDRIDRLTSVSC